MAHSIVRSLVELLRTIDKHAKALQVAATSASEGELRIAAKNAAADLRHLHANEMKHFCATPNTSSSSTDNGSEIKLEDCELTEPSISLECVASLPGHRETVFCIAAVGTTRLVSASDDKSLKVWDVESRKCMGTLLGHTAEVTGVAAFGSDLCVSSSKDKTLRLWNICSGHCLATMVGHTRPVMGVAALKSDLAVSASADGHLKTWSVDGDSAASQVEPIASLGDGEERHKGGILCITVVDGRVASGANDKTIRVWDVDTKACQATLQGHTGAICGLAPLGTSQLLSGSKDKTARIWDLSSFSCIATLEGHLSYVRFAVGFSEGYAVTASSDRTMKLWEIKGARCIRTLDGHHQDTILCLAGISSTLLASCSDDMNIKLWQVSEAK